MASSSTPRSSAFGTFISKCLLATANSKHFPRKLTSQRGFVLPVAVLITLVLALIAATVVTRSFNRGQQATGERARQVVNNEVRQAIDRSRAKLDYLFNPATQAGGRLPQGRPGNSLLVSLLLDGATVDGVSAPPPVAGQSLSFQLQDESPLVLNSSIPAPAWWFNVDTDNDGTVDAVTGYAILTNTTNAAGTIRVENGPPEQDKANNLVVRNVALQGISTSGNCLSAAGAGLPIDTQGSWFRTTQGQFVKPIQVVAVTVPTADSDSNTRAISAVQMQQDRYREGLSEYGAYFRADLEVFPGPSFNWNGKVYSEGNIMIGGNDRFAAFLISDPDSCFYNPAARSSFSSPFELISGTMKNNAFGFTSKFHLQDGSDNPPVRTLNTGSDSVDGAADPNELAINPGLLFTQGVHRPNYVINGGSLGEFRATSWAGSDLATGGITNNPRVELLNLGAGDEPPPAPYVDDFYRADNRCGPRPNYGSANLPSGCTNSGDAIDSSESTIISDAPLGGDPTAVGLDGYWERRARNEGLRIIVGQRLNLIQGHPDNPDIPSFLDANDDGLEAAELQGAFPNAGLAGVGSIGIDIDNNDRVDMLEQAVQATALYHYDSANPDVPVACLSTLSDASGNSPVPNHEEFVPPAVTAVDNLADPMMVALANLSRLSSDGDDRSAATNAVTLGTIGNGITDPVAGAFPPFQEAAGTARSHPNPALIRYGDFSNLRRALEIMDGGTSFNNLSIADKSYIYTAACSVGMLATTDAAGGGIVRPTLDFAGGDGISGTLDDLSGTGPNRIPGDGDDSDPFLPLTAAEFRQANFIALNSGPDGNLGNADDPISAGEDGILSTADDLKYLDFSGPDGILNTGDDAIYVGSGTLLSLDWSKPAADVLFNGGNPIDNAAEFDSAIADTSNTLGGIDFDPALADAHPLLADATMQAIFNPDGTWGSGDERTMAQVFDLSGASLGDTEAMRSLILGAILGVDGNGGTRRFNSAGSTLWGNDGNISTVGPDGIPGTPDDIAPELVDDIIRIDEGADQIYGSADDPDPVRAIFQGVDPAGLVLVNNGSTPLANNVQDVNIFNGRERLMVRTLDLNLGNLRAIAQGADFIFPRSGIIYAFREDAVPEDAIARPVGGVIANDIPTSTPDREAVDASGNINCNNAVQPTSNNTTCVYLRPYQGTDPQLTALNTALDQDAMGGISTKPVDYYVDPLRRPHSFRLSNGARLARVGDGNRGMSLITYNPVYINGDFNLHTEFEFTTNRGVEDGNFTIGEFYGRSGINTSFADGASDEWRPSEILSDAITVTSNFNDANRPGTNPALNLPGVEGRYGRRNQNAASATVNAIMVSGIVPSRAQESFGGLHNFPRFIQAWGSSNLVIAGSFIQLNFSTQATAPFDQQTWPREADGTPVAGAAENIGYYGPPRRRWGYDVALQYAPTSPIASRFDIPSNVRDEFVRDLPADDPYVRVIRCALQSAPGANVTADPGLGCP